MVALAESNGLDKKKQEIAFTQLHIYASLL